ncbi:MULTISPECIES: hypothetical protein [unclassified Treponema]|nr:MULTISPECIES: hypothetical protein [unclassified Treponema]
MKYGDKKYGNIKHISSLSCALYSLKNKIRHYAYKRLEGGKLV